MKTVGQRHVYMIRAVVELILGVLFILFPRYISGATGLVIGTFLVLHGIMDLIGYLRADASFGRSFLLAGAIVSMFTGIVFILFPHSFMALLAIIAGLFIIVTGVSKYASAMLVSGGGPLLFFSKTVSILEVILGIVILINPFGGVEAMIIMFGIGLLIGGGRNLASFIRNDPVRF